MVNKSFISPEPNQWPIIPPPAGFLPFSPILPIRLPHGLMEGTTLMLG